MVVALVGVLATGDFSLEVVFWPVTNAIHEEARPIPVAGPTVRERGTGRARVRV